MSDHAKGFPERAPAIAPAIVAASRSNEEADCRKRAALLPEHLRQRKSRYYRGLRPGARAPGLRFQIAATIQAPEEKSKLFTLKRTAEHGSEPFNVVRAECGDLISFPTIVGLNI